MSKSGVPVVSQVAEATHTIGTSIGDIFEGKNVFESLGRVVAAPFAATIDLTNDITFHKLEGAPLGVGQLLQGGSEFAENPYSREAALKTGGGVLQVGATVGGAVVGGPAISGALGVSGGTGAVLGGLAANKIASGGNVFDALSPLAGQGLSNLAGDYGINASDFSGLRPSSGPVQPAQKPPMMYSNNVMAAPITENSGMTVFFLLLAGLAVFLVMRRVS